MSIKDLDYKLQGPKLEKAILDVYMRDNYMHGRYERGGGFGLDFYSSDYQIENHRWITERADVADKLIAQAQLEGKNVDDPEVLKVIAGEVDENIKSGKRNGSWLNYVIYLIIPAILIWFLFF